VLVAGVAVGLVGVKRASDAPTPNGPDASAARVMGIAGDVLAGVGIVGAGVGVVLLVMQARKPASSMRLSPAPHGIAIAF
jgi:hypothetical protein